MHPHSSGRPPRSRTRGAGHVGRVAIPTDRCAGEPDHGDHQWSARRGGRHRIAAWSLVRHNPGILARSAKPLRTAPCASGYRRSGQEVADARWSSSIVLMSVGTSRVYRFLFRHCERSKAIQYDTRKSGLLLAYAPRNDENSASPITAASAAASCDRAQPAHRNPNARIPTRGQALRKAHACASCAKEFHTRNERRIG